MEGACGLGLRKPFSLFSKGNASPLLPWEMGGLLRRLYRQVCRRGCAAGMLRPKGRAEPGAFVCCKAFPVEWGFSLQGILGP